MSIRAVVVLIALTLPSPRQLHAQAIFDAFGIPKTVTATGHTEVIGSIIISHRLNISSADTIVIDLSPFRITNASPSDIQLAASGTLTFGSVAIEAAAGRVRIPINAGGSSGSVRIDGIRVSIAGTNATSVSARLTFGGNLNILNTPSVTVVNQVQSGLEAEPMTDNFRVINNTVYDSTAAIDLREGFETSFTSTHQFGQNNATEIRIRVTDFPSGLRMTFPASVVSPDSAATLNTLEGTSITLPRDNGDTTVTYSFAGAGNSADITESFRVPFTVAAEGVVSILQPTIDVALFPIGAAVPSDALPSTSVPRFTEENLNVLAGTSRIITKTMFWTGIENSRENRLSLFNPGSTSTNVTLSAFDAAGQLIESIASSLPISLPSHHSLNQTLAEIFGIGAANIATVRVQSTRADLLALGVTGAPGLSESTALVSQTIFSFNAPVFGDQTRVSVFNPHGVRVSGTIAFRPAAGTTLAVHSLDLDPLTTSSLTIQELFGIQASGYVFGSFERQIVALQSSGGADDLSLIAPQPPAGLPAVYAPFFAVGGGYQTDLSLINISAGQVELTARIYDNSGSELGSARIISLAPNEQLVGTVSEVFQLQGTHSGYLRIQVPVVNRAFFNFYPLITGNVRIRSAQLGAAVISILGYPQPDSFVLNSGAVAGSYQGLAVINPNSSAVTVTLQALNSSGIVLETANFDLGAGRIHSKLISELFAAALPEESVIRVTATGPVFATSVTGSTSGDMLRSSPALR